jgi:predicted Zn finger-like uncharacterized protein
VIAKCPTCEARYKVADEKVSPGGTKFKCKKCKTAFTVYRETPERSQQAPERRAPTMRNCPHCGKPIPVQAIKCRWCREQVAGAPAESEGAGFEGQEGAYAPEGEHQDPFAPQGEPGAEHQDPFAPPAAGAGAFDDEEGFGGGGAGYGGPPPPGGPPGGGGMADISVSGKRINPSLFTFPLWGGLVAAVAGGAMAGTKDNINMTGIVLMLVGGSAMIFAAVYLLISLYRCWNVMPASARRTTPGRAVGFMFIPLFNLYWVFVAFNGLAEDANAFLSRTGARGNIISRGVSMAYCITYILGIFVPFVSLVSLILVTVLIYQWAGFVNSLVRA